MTYARTIAAAITATIAVALAPQIASSATVETAAVPAVHDHGHIHHEPVVALPEVEAADIIDGVRIIADTAARTEMASEAIEKFAAAGWSLTNTEIRWSDDACDGAVGFHAEERGHHVIVMCADSEWTMLHELGHVWAALHLDEVGEAEWVDRRGLNSWHEGPYHERGTEQAAQVIAFGLFDSQHIPTMSNNDYFTLVEDFEWLFNTEPVHRQRGTADDTATATEIRISAGPSHVHEPVDAPATEVTLEEHVAPVEYQFPLACGFPRWHSSHGGYGYVDPRDWTHVGVDLYAFEGTPVVSPVYGTVTAAGWGDVSGWRATVEDRFGYEHVMVHLSEPPVVSAGMEVVAGQTIGRVGRSGNASGGGPHLHYEIRTSWGMIDPMPWLRATGQGSAEAAPQSFYSVSAPAMAGCDTRD